MTYLYARLDAMRCMNWTAEELNWLRHAPDVEYREDYLCWFIRRESKTYTYLVLKHGNIFD